MNLYKLDLCLHQKILRTSLFTNKNSYKSHLADLMRYAKENYPEQFNSLDLTIKYYCNDNLLKYFVLKW